MLWLLGGYMWLYIHRPFEIWEVLGTNRLERVYMLGTILFWLAYQGKGWIANRLNPAFALLFAALVIAWLGSPYMPAGTKVVEDQFKVAVFYVLAITTVRDERSLRKLLLAYLVAVGLYMTHSLWEYHNGRGAYRMEIWRMIGVDATYSDPNTFAATLVYSLMMTLPFWMTRSGLRARLLLVGYTGLTVLCIILTGSRSGLIGLLCTVLFLALASEQRKKVLPLLLLSAPFVWLLTPLELKHRFLTIIDPSYGPANAQQSAYSRRLGFELGVQLWQERLIVGYGPASFAKAAGTGFQAHSLYGQTLAETGTLGALALLAVVLAFWSNAREVKQIHRAHPLLPRGFSFHLARGVSIAVVVLLIMGLAGHNLYRYTWMWFGAFQAIAIHCTRTHAAMARHQYHMPQQYAVFPRG